MPAGERESLDWLFRGRIPVRPPAVRVALRFLSAVSARRDYRYPEHRHPGYELIVPGRGLYRCTIDGAAYEARPGQVVVVQCGDLHADDVRRGQRYRALGLDVTGPTGEVLRVVGGAQRTVDVRLDDLLDALAGESERCDTLAAARQDALAGEALWRVLRALPPAAVALGRDGERERFADAVERLFRANASRRLPVPAMARALGMGATAVHAAFRTHLGCSPARAFARWRVAEARRLLGQGDFSVSAVAAHLGFANPYHFARVVRRHAGLPPSRLRGGG